MGRLQYYYDVIPATSRFRGSEALTYVASNKLSLGQIVLIDFRNRQVLGIVVSESKKPEMTVKELLNLDNDIVLPKNYLELLTKSLLYYPGYPGATAQLFASSFIRKIKEYKEETNDITHDPELPQLTDEQLETYRAINEDKPTFIVHGETGSGKTRVYLEIAKDMIAKNKSVLVLTPEISLTAPLAKNFKEVFGDIVLINHSSLTPVQKSKIWSKVLYSSKPTIVIGPRSSLFIPISRLGLIVVDEFHESAYKQESAPYYSAIRMASILAKESGSKLVLGSATPSINEYFLAENKNIPILRMKKQAITKKMRSFDTKIIDLSDKNERSKIPLISSTLLKMLREQIDNKRQSLLFINKRGSARTITCQDCGWRCLCPNCDLPLVYHSDDNQIRCHTCGFKRQPIYNCPECNSNNILFKNPGTKTIVEQLNKIFPTAKIVRFDKDNKKSERLENNYEAIKNGDVDIIVGTQLLIKGHDLPNLGLVAMLQADSSLNFPDFSSEERSFQMIRQLSGRVGRGHQAGKVLIQTFNPANPLLEMALSGSWKDFYKSQIKQRQQLGFPPFYHALKIEVSRKTRQSASLAMDKLSEKLIEQFGNNIVILGPSPCFIEKKTGLYNWQIIVKSKNRDILREILINLNGFKANIDPADFL